MATNQRDPCVPADAVLPTLFSARQRSYHGWAGYAETEFAFLDRSARPQLARARSLLDGWYARYPEVERADLRGRMRKAQFESAFHELLLHELLLRLGAHRVDLHPQVHGERGYVPDFLITEPGVEPWFLEGRAATDLPDADRRQNAILFSLYDEIDKLTPDAFFVSLESPVLRSGRQPSGKHVRAFLARELGMLDPENPAHGRGELRLLYQDPDLRLTFRPYAIRTEARGNPTHRIIGSLPSKSRWGGTDGPIADALRRKGGRYGRPPGAYVVGVNSISEWGTRQEDAVRALYGEMATLTAQEKSWTTSKLAPGVFGPRVGSFSRVSAVLVTTAGLWNLSVADAWLCHNPWTERPYEGGLRALSEVWLRDGDVHRKPGLTLREVLEVPESWPGT